MNFYQKFPSGVISLSEIIGLVSFTGMFTAFTIIVMQRRKLVKQIGERIVKKEKKMKKEKWLKILS